MSESTLWLTTVTNQTTPACLPAVWSLGMLTRMTSNKNRYYWLIEVGSDSVCLASAGEGLRLGIEGASGLESLRGADFFRFIWLAR